MTDEELTAIRERAEAARTAIYAVAAQGDRAFRMSIPPQEEDTDLLVSGVCDDVAALVAEVERLRGVVTRGLTFTFCANNELTGCRNPVRASRAPCGLCERCAAEEITRLREELGALRAACEEGAE